MQRTKMMTMVCGLLLTGTTSILADELAPALDGYCPVCLVKMDKLVKGDAAYSSVHDGKRYLFPGADQKQMFDKNPSAFVPALGGDCTVCKVEMDNKVAGKAEFHSVYDGRLFLFPSEKQKGMFDREPQKYADADLALGGKCPVCLIKMNKVMSGSADYATVYDGERYLFPGAEQKQMFDADPAAFTPALGGACTVCKIEKNKKVTGAAEFHITHGGRLYLFPSAKQMRMFQDNPDKYADADLALHGYCPVCKVDMGKDIAGKADVAAVYNGLRYLFPGKKQLDMFVSDPAKYVVQ